MNKTLLAGLAILALASGSAIAADMPPPAFKAPPAPTPTWTGCYINGGGGYGMSNIDHNLETLPGLAALDLNTTAGGRGWFGTAGAGCDYQFNAFNNWNVVVGAFGDYNFMDIHGHVNDAFSGLGGNVSEDWAWAGGLRAGILVTPSLLTYINGGFTQTGFGLHNLSSTFTGAPSGFAVPSHTFDGWFIGGGTEYAVPGIPGLFWRNEYRFSTYQTSDVANIVAATGAPAGTANRTQPTVQTIATELVFRFNWLGL